MLWRGTINCLSGRVDNNKRLTKPARSISGELLSKLHITCRHFCIGFSQNFESQVFIVKESAVNLLKLIIFYFHTYIVHTSPIKHKGVVLGAVAYWKDRCQIRWHLMVSISTLSLNWLLFHTQEFFFLQNELLGTTTMCMQVLSSRRSAAHVEQH